MKYYFTLLIERIFTILDLNGNIKLTYQCDWVSIDKKISVERLLDENDGVYCAPELGRGNSITPAVDWWSVGKFSIEKYKVFE